MPASCQTDPDRDAGLLRITHADRIVDADSGTTKRELVLYYAEVARWALPFYAGRPAYIRRAPRGLAGPLVFQQHTLDMKGLRGTDPALWPRHDPAIALDTPHDLANAAQLDAIELHTWNSTAAAIDRPDRLVFDLDPGEGLGWDAVQRGALAVRELLQALGLQAWAKTTGGKGLHVFVPLQPELDYPTARAFTQAVVRHLAATAPDLFVSRSGPRNRVGRLYVDYLRNGWAQSTAEAYSARARPGLGVSMPIAWAQLDEVAHGAHWTVRDALAHLRRRRRDPWASYWRTPQSLEQAMRRLGWGGAGA